MASIGIIYSYMPNPRVMKIQAAASLNDRTVDIDPNFVMGKTNKSPEYLRDFPLGKVPGFKSLSGFALFESDAIAQYAAESGPASSKLLGSTAEERAIIRQWIEFADNEIHEPLQPLILWRFGKAPYNEETEKKSMERLKISLDVLENRLKIHEFAATEHLSLADLSLAAAMYWGYGQIIDTEMREQQPATVDWYLRVIGHPKVKQAFGAKIFIEVRTKHPE